MRGFLASDHDDPLAVEAQLRKLAASVGSFPHEGLQTLREMALLQASRLGLVGAAAQLIESIPVKQAKLSTAEIAYLQRILEQSSSGSPANGDEIPTLLGKDGVLGSLSLAGLVRALRSHPQVILTDKTLLIEWLRSLGSQGNHSQGGFANLPMGSLSGFIDESVWKAMTRDVLPVIGPEFLPGLVSSIACWAAHDAFQHNDVKKLRQRFAILRSLASTRSLPFPMAAESEYCRALYFLDSPQDAFYKASDILNTTSLALAPPESLFWTAAAIRRAGKPFYAERLFLHLQASITMQDRSWEAGDGAGTVRAMAACIRCIGEKGDKKKANAALTEYLDVVLKLPQAPTTFCFVYDAFLSAFSRLANGEAIGKLLLTVGETGRKITPLGLYGLIAGHRRVANLQRRAARRGHSQRAEWNRMKEYEKVLKQPSKRTPPTALPFSMPPVAQAAVSGVAFDDNGWRSPAAALVADVDDRLESLTCTFTDVQSALSLAAHASALDTAQASSARLGRALALSTPEAAYAYFIQVPEENHVGLGSLGCGSLPTTFVRPLPNFLRPLDEKFWEKMINGALHLCIKRFPSVSNSPSATAPHAIPMQAGLPPGEMKLLEVDCCFALGKAYGMVGDSTALDWLSPLMDSVSDGVLACP